MLSVSGSYVGNGTASQSVTGLGFQPDIVIVKDIGNNYDTYFRTKDMPTNTSYPVRSDAASNTDHILSLDTNGFTVGSNIEANGSTHAYVYLAMKDNGAGDFSTVTYTGAGGDDVLVFTAFQPTYTLLKSNNSIVGAQKFFGQPSATGTPTSNIASMQFGGGGDRNDLIYFGVDGLRVSNGDNSGGNLVNQTGFAHFGFVLKDTSGLIQTGSYVGNAASRTITTTFQPIWINIRGSGSQAPDMQYSAQMASGNSNGWDNIPSTGRISGANSTGFTLSADGNVNSTGITYWYTAIGAKAVTPTAAFGSNLMMMGV